MAGNEWQRSSFCGGGGNNCVEVAAAANGVALRESNTPDEALTTDRTALRSLIRSVKAGTLQHPPS
jgi:hypothetical protein